MKRFLILLLLLSTCGWAQPQEKDKATHDELRAMKDECVAALNAGDFEAVLALVDDEIVFTAIDAKLAHGKDELRAYFDKMLKGPDRLVEGMTTTVTIDRLTTLYGQDFGVATGSSSTVYKLAKGKSLTIDDRFTATVVKKNGRWLMASFHSSADLFDNPILTLANNATKLVGLLAAVIFALIGFVVGRASKRRIA